MQPTSKISATLSPLPPVLHQGLLAVAVLGVISFVASTSLFLFIGYRIICWKRRRPNQQINQFVLLIFNLLLADIQQAVGFALNARWVIQDGIMVGTSTCWAQAWSVQNGNLASGVWCSVIGIHTFASVLFNYRVKPATFYSVMILLWVCVYACAIIGLALHPHDLYVRAGAWCWVDAKYNGIRLWLHYFWIFIAEFGTVIVYGALYIALINRLRSNYYTPVMAKHAKQAAWLMALYPAIYIMCTLPIASSRMMSLAGTPPSLHRLCVSGAMITSNGWLDVLVYTLTRRISLLGPDPPTENCGIETFTVPWETAHEARFGTVTTIEALAKPKRASHSHKGSFFRSHEALPTVPESRSGSQQSMHSGSMDELVWTHGPGKHKVHTETTVDVRSEPLELEDIQALSFQRLREQRVLHTPTSSQSNKEGFKFETTPPGYGQS